MRIVALVLALVVAAPVVVPPSAEPDMQSIARVTKLRRIGKKAREVRRREAGPPPHPGPLLEFVPRISVQNRAPYHLIKLASAVERSIFERVRACFSIPVRHGKTTLVQHAIAWIFCVDPTARVLYVSYAHGFAKKQGAKARELAVRAGVQLGSGRRKDEWTTAQGGLFKAVGIGGQITGEGFTHIFVDDPHKNRAEAESRTIRDGVIEAFFNDIYTRLDPRGTSFFVIHARWNVNDLIGVLSRADPHPFERHNSPAINDNGDPLAPWLFSREQLEELRDTLGPYTWASLYQGEPRPRAGSLFIDPTLSQIWVPKAYRTVIGIDLASSVRTRSDYNAAVVMRKNVETGTSDVVEAVRARGAIMDRMRDRELVDEGFVRQVARLVTEHPGCTLVMYAMDNEAPLVKLFEKLLAEALGRPVHVMSLPIKGDKYMRALRYAASWNAGRVRIPGRAKVTEKSDETLPDDGRNREGWQHAFCTQHVEFTGVKGAEDDWVDAGAAAHDYLNPLEDKTTLADAMTAARGKAA
jgi:hypothetical protein